MSKHLERYYEVEDSTLKTFNDVLSKTALPIRIEFKIFGDAKLKKLIEMKKYAPEDEYMFKSQIKIKINEDLLNNLDDDESVELLIRECLNGLEINTETGVLKIVKPDISTFASIMEKFSLDSVKRAKELEKLTLQQTEERKAEEGF